MRVEQLIRALLTVVLELLESLEELAHRRPVWALPFAVSRRARSGWIESGWIGFRWGTVASISMYALVKMNHSLLALIALSSNAKDMAENMYRGLWSWLICVFVTVAVKAGDKVKFDADQINGQFTVTKIQRTR